MNGRWGGAPSASSSAVSVIDWMDQAPLDLTLEMLIAMCIAGGWGWMIGLALGWFGSLDRQGPSKVGRAVGIMFALAVGFLWFGLSSMRCARHGSFGPMIDDIGAHDPLRDRLASVSPSTPRSWPCP
jgi:hypothetical protein